MAAPLTKPPKRPKVYDASNADEAAARVRDVLNYDPETGVFRWAKSRGTQKAGALAGTMVSGYLMIALDWRQYGAHRLAWLYMTGKFPLHQVDHINGDKTDNRFVNLRDVDRSVNQQNLKKARSNNISSGLLGVTFHKKDKKYRARITHNQKRIELGSFDDKHEAYAVYLEAKRRLHVGCTI